MEAFPTPRTILCGVDRSAGAAQALRLAAELGGRLGSRLVLAHVGAPEAEARSLLEDLAARERIDVEIRAERGDPAERLLAVAADVEAGMIALGSGGRGPARAAVLGSVSSAVARGAPCPVLMAPESATVRPLTEEGSLVVCGVDSSDGAAQALRVAARLVSRVEASLALVHVCLPPTVPGTATSPGADELLAEVETRQGKRLLAELAAGEQLGSDVERQLVFGEPAEALAEVAAERDAALLVVGRRGRGGLKSALFGTVSGELAARAPCPVLVVPNAAARAGEPGAAAAMPQ